MMIGHGCEVPLWSDVDVESVADRVRLVAFDLDNTLARSRLPMSGDMSRAIAALTRMLPVGVITGGRFALVTSQVLSMLDDTADLSSLHLMPTSGASYYRWDGSGSWRQIYAIDIDPHRRHAVIESFERRARELGLWEEHVWGERIEDRGSQITFSALGQQAPLETKLTWDPDGSKRQRLTQAVAADVPDLLVRSGGHTSVDVTDKGIDKAFAVTRLSQELGIDVGQMVFVGDRMSEGGNDYPAAKAGTMAIRVTGPHDTLQWCDRLLKALRRVRGRTDQTPLPTPH